MLLCGFVGDAQEKQPVHVVIQAAPEQIKKAALAMFVRSGYSLDSETASQLKISHPFSSEETNAYNTAHWTSQPVANCRHVEKLMLSAVDHTTGVAMVSDMVCHQDGSWLILRIGDKNKISWMQATLADLKTKTEQADQPH